MSAQDFNGIFKNMHNLVGSTVYTVGDGFPRLTDSQYLRTVKTEETIILWVELPGVSTKDIEIEIDAKSNSLHFKVNSKGQFFSTFIETHQTISMDADLDAEVETLLVDGILTLVFPIKASAKPRKLEVKTAN